MQRIRIPDKLIAIILSLFEERENSIITDLGYTDPHKVTIGTKEK
jgi:hypothetical protein